MGERPTPDAPHPGRRRPPRAPSCRPHSAQSQLAGARALGLLTGPRARTPRTRSQWVVGPGRTPERTEAVAGGPPDRYPKWLARALNSAIYDVKWDYEGYRTTARIAVFYVKIAVFFTKFPLLCPIL